jgi:hypothetical protein
MPRLPLLALVLLVPTVADACPFFSRCRRPRPVVYYLPPCPAPTPAAPAQPAEEPVKWSAVRGRVVFEGDPIPKQTPIRGANGAYTEDWVVNPANRGVKNVIVWLAPEPTPEQLNALKTRRLREFPGFKPDEIHSDLAGAWDRTIYIPIKPIAFVPHVLAMRAGETLTFENYSGGPEVVKYDSDKNGPDRAVVPPGRDGELFRRKMVTERMPIVFESAVTPWLRAYVRVFDHPYFAVTNADGEFEIPYAPVGNLRIFYWQETSGYRNGAAGRLGEPIKVEKKVMDLGDVKLKPAKD